MIISQHPFYAFPFLAIFYIALIQSYPQSFFSPKLCKVPTWGQNLMRMKEQLPAVTHTHTHTLTQTEKVFTSRGNHLKYKATWWACLLLLLLCVLLCFSLVHSVTPVTALSNDKNDGSFYSILFSVLFLLLLYNQFQKTGSSYKGVKREKAWGKHGEENE